MSNLESLIEELNTASYNYYNGLPLLMSDAEYAMYEDKLVLKKAPGYRERLEKGLNLK